MDIQCNSCGTTYFFDESRATGERMRFKCSKCGNIFDAQVSVPKAVEEDLHVPEEIPQMEMDNHLEQMEGEEEFKEDFREDFREEFREEYREEDHFPPEKSPIIVEGIIGAAEAGLDIEEMPDIDIGEPPPRITMESPLARRGRGVVWRLAPSILVAVLLIAAIVFGIYLVGSTMAPDLTAFLPRSIQHFFTRTHESSVKDLVLTGEEGFFSRNNAVGHIYVVKGYVENRGDMPYSNIRVKGMLYNKEGVPLMEREVLCGIDISNRDLATLPGDDIYARMTAHPPEGTEILQPSRTIPYTVVFIDLPKDIYEYSISIVEAELIP